MISKCRANCKHEGQDKLHGEGFRVLNHRPSKDKSNEVFACTVCNTVHSNSEIRPK